MLLTSHYMRDVEALCPRVLVITEGQVVFDGPLAGILERFGSTKLLKLHFAGDEAPAGLDRFGACKLTGPTAELHVERQRVSEVLSAILDQYTIVDMSVQDPPLEEVIAHVFEAARAKSDVASVGA
jgi:ABC-2 type transport system ATP-binding protein